jgi:uncharacterized protein (DUF433 family)
MTMAEPQFGIGVYSVPEAARLIGMRSQMLRRWVSGYDDLEAGQSAAQKPLWSAQYAKSDENQYLGFRDLVEARIVKALRLSGIPLQTVRRCLERARAIIGDDHPFSTRSFKSDGKTLFLEIMQSGDDPILIDLRQGQQAFKAISAQSLNGLEFGDEVAERWWLLTGKKTIVADPGRSFGHPIIASNGMSTKCVAEAVLAEGSIERVAQLYEMRISEVNDAVIFEQRLKGSTLH